MTLPLLAAQRLYISLLRKHWSYVTSQFLFLSGLRCNSKTHSLYFCPFLYYTNLPTNLTSNLIRHTYTHTLYTITTPSSVYHKISWRWRQAPTVPTHVSFCLTNNSRFFMLLFYFLFHARVVAFCAVPPFILFIPFHFLSSPNLPPGSPTATNPLNPNLSQPIKLMDLSLSSPKSHSSNSIKTQKFIQYPSWKPTAANSPP